MGARTAQLTGVNATGQVGNMFAVYWSLIDDNQNPSWQNIGDAQTPGWSTIDDNQTPNWTVISTG
jgi:hypothetical protein